jgi:hypothetical protein
MDKVLVKDGRNGNSYHKIEDGTPACLVNGNEDPENWHEWELSKAKAWKEPCQNADCYGNPDVNGAKTGDKWPV